MVEPGHTAAWYNPERSGEGLLLEILPDDRALVYWFTYDEEGGQRWLTGVGNVLQDEDGQYIHFPELLITRGGEFGPDFDKDKVVREVAGEGVLRFTDCNTGEWAWDVLDQPGSTTVQRLSQTMGAGCQSINGEPGYPIESWAGQSGSWYDTGHSGEGFVLQWLHRGEALLYWFSYDPEGKQYWMFGVGTEVDGQIVIPEMYATRGARFGDAFDKEDVEVFPWGSLNLAIDCTAGTASYTSTVGSFGNGDQQLTRLTQVAQPACPWVKPKLTDLYEFTWTELPIEPNGPQDNNNIQAESIADDGTVVAKLKDSGTTTIVVWRPGAENWEALTGLEAASGARVQVSKDGTTVASNEEINPDDGFPYNPAIWQVQTGWSVVIGNLFDTSYLVGVSKDLSQLVGIGGIWGSPIRTPWIWNEEAGQRILPETEEIRGGRPYAASNDGLIVVGESGFVVPGVSFPVMRATRWEGDSDPWILTDSQGFELGIAVDCSADCSVVAGAAQFPYSEEHPNSLKREAWYWRDDGHMAYLGSLDDAVLEGANNPFIPRDMTDDGSMIVGGYAIEMSPGLLGSRGFTWTQNTGLVSVREIIQEADIGDDNWEEMTAVSISSTGEMILLAGTYDSEILHRRAAILELKLKE